MSAANDVAIQKKALIKEKTFDIHFTVLTGLPRFARNDNIMDSFCIVTQKTPFV